MQTRVKTAGEIIAMRESGRILASVLSQIKRLTKPGVTGKDVSRLARRELAALGGTPSFLGYQGFPDVICISVNDEVEHGIPNDIPFVDGDVVSFDFGVTHDGMVTDSGLTMIVGKAREKASVMLVETTHAALQAGIGVVRNGVRVGDISAAVQAVLDAGNYGIVRDLVGHGVGHALHEDPDIPNYGASGTGQVLEAGMTVAIEPMATLGGHKLLMDPDGWTIRTRDGSLAAHFEHTVLVTESGAEILTAF